MNTSVVVNTAKVFVFVIQELPFASLFHFFSGGYLHDLFHEIRYYLVTYIFGTERM